MEDRGQLALFSCGAGKPFFRKVLEELNKIYDKEFGRLRKTQIYTPKTREVKFSNGEIKTVIEDYVRGKDIYIIQEFDSPLCEKNLHENIMALMTAADAARYSDADSITAVIPQFPYSKQNKISKREGIGARIIASMLENSGVDRVLTLDIHEKAIQGFFNHTKLDNIYASVEFIKYIKENLRPNISNLVFVAHDLGAAEMARFYSEHFNVDMAIVRAYNDSTNTDDEFQLVGDVFGKDVIVVKNTISTGRTVLKAVDILNRKGARSVTLFTSFPFFNTIESHADFEKYFKENKIKKVVGTNSVFKGEDFIKNNDWYDEVSVASLFAEVIFSINHKLSVSELLKKKKIKEKIDG